MGGRGAGPRRRRRRTRHSPDDRDPLLGMTRRTDGAQADLGASFPSHASAAEELLGRASVMVRLALIATRAPSPTVASADELESLPRVGV